MPDQQRLNGSEGMKGLVFALIASIAICAPAHAGPMESITEFLGDVATGQAELGPQTATEWIAMRCVALYGALEHQASKRKDDEKMRDFINRATTFDSKVDHHNLRLDIIAVIAAGYIDDPAIVLADRPICDNGGKVPALRSGN
jgi:hypothetical protein